MGQNWSILVPEATVNLCTNPSFEKATTGWVASGSNTIARNASQQYAGVYALLCTYQNSLTLASYAVASGVFGAARTYTVTAKLYVPDSWDGGDINLDATGFTGITVTQVRQWASTDEKEKWVELEIKFTIISDVTGSIILETDSPPTASRQVYLDSVQIEEKAYATSYCDGDQGGCSWTGAKHASPSTRDQFEASGGRVMNLDSDFGFLTGLDEGTGVFPLEMLFRPQPLLPGDKFQGINVLSRNNLLLRGGFEGDTTPDFHAKRQALINALNSRVGRIDLPPQARQLIYHGAAVEKQIGVHYVAGLGVKDRIGTLGERVDGLQFYAPESPWYARGERGAVLGTSGSDTFALVAAKIDGQWGNMGVSFSPAGTDRVYDWAEDDTYLYFCGNFLNFNGNSAIDYVGRYEKATGTFSPMPGGTPPNATVRSITVAPNGDVYIGGEFTSVGGSSIARVARNNGTSWSALGSGVNGTVYALVFGNDGFLYVGGDHSSAGGVANTACIAGWNGSSWFALDTGISSTYLVYTIAVSPDGSIIAGGTFLDVGTRVARWDGASWSNLGSGLTEVPRSMVFDSSGRLYAGTISGSVLEWNGQAWQTIGTATASVGSPVIYAVGFHDGYLYVAGFFDGINGTSVYRVARWNRSAWSRVDITFDLTSSETIFTFFVSSAGDLYIGGSLDGTANYSVQTTIAYYGTEKAYPTLEISRSGGDRATIVELFNLDTRASLRFDYSLADGETLTVVLNPAKLSVISSYYGSVPRAIIPGSDTTLFHLSPGNQSGGQDNRIVSLVDVEGSPTVTAVMRWRDTYQSYD